MTNRQQQSQREPLRHAFLLTLWQEQADGPWRASLRPTGEDERLGFAGIELLAAYLMRLTTPDASESSAGGARASPDGRTESCSRDDAGRA